MRINYDGRWINRNHSDNNYYLGCIQFAGNGVMNNPFNNNRIGNMPNKENTLEILKKVIWYFGLCSCTWRIGDNSFCRWDW